jgi:hypothetical protein
MEILCHYTNYKSPKNILETMKLWFGKVIKSNDPIEIKKMMVSPSRESEITKEFIKYHGLYNNDMRDYLNDILYLASFSESNFEDDKIFTEISDECNISDLKYRPAFYLPRMWATYGENHKGVCLVFDKKILISIVEKQLEKGYNFVHGSITYSDFIFENELKSMWQTYSLELDDVVKNGYNSIQEYLINYNSNYFIKDIDWKDEKEYRFLCWNKLNNLNIKENIKIDIRDALVGIVFGINSHVKELLKIATTEELKIFVYKIGYDEELILTSL